MRLLVVWIGIVAIGGLLLPATAVAQGGSISGSVEDTTGGILPGVTVAADSPVNIEGTLTAFTDGAGRYTIINLRPGTYTVTFTLPGFNTFVREGIIMSGELTVQVNGELAVGTLEETVTVSGESPVVDVQQNRRQFVATRQMLDVLPQATDAGARAVLIPGVRNDGMTHEGETWPTAHGSTMGDATTFNDGMRANSIIGDGNYTIGWEMNEAATAELTFDAGGAPAEAQAGGVVMNAIPKEGGNTISGQWFTYYTRGSLQRLCLADELLARRSLEGLGNGWARTPEQRGKEFGEVDESLSCGADDAGEDLLGLRAAGRPIAATDFAIDDGRADGLLGTPVGRVHLGRPQEGEHGGEFAVEMGGEALGGRQGGRRVEEPSEAREQAPTGHGEAVIGERVCRPSVAEREGVGEDRLHAGRPRTVRMIRGQRACPS